MRRSREPFLWALFSSGGMLSALVWPAVIFVLWIAQPLGWIEPASHNDLLDLLRHPIARLVLFVLVFLSLFHWAHRFRFTLYDGLQLYHLHRLVAVVTYGAATLLTIMAGYVVWTL